MERHLFKSIISDNKAIKFGEWSGQYFIYEPDNLVIGFFFMHRGYPKNYFTDSDRRIILTAFPYTTLNADIPLKQIEDRSIIMVNSDHLDYSMTFLLNVDIAKRMVKVKINDMPELGKSIITNEEKNGIEIQY